MEKKKKNLQITAKQIILISIEYSSINTYIVAVDNFNKTAAAESLIIIIGSPFDV